ncbi:MAG TPA: terminase family protein [Phycisphaerae bacterium]|nr:terminase family protein [Phycisphaerae bacterium]
MRNKTELAALNLLAYQDAAVNCPARFTWNCWARQTGKSFTFSLRRLVRGLARKRTQIFLSAGERQSREVMEKTRLHCVTLKIWHEWHDRGYFRGTRFRQLEIRLPGKVRIIGLPANPLTARGYSGDIFLDEFAMHRDDEAIWAALYPSVLRAKGELDVASTPRGQKNMFHRLAENDAFERGTMTLEAAVAGGLEVDIAALRKGIADDLTWRQEFCCEFADEATSFMTYELIRKCHDVRLSTEVDARALARRGAAIYAGVDVGRHRDLTVIWLWERQVESFFTRGVIVMQAAPFAEQEAVLAELLKSRGLRRCCIDATGLGMQLAERLAASFGEHRVEGVSFTAALKSELAGRLRVLAERGHLSIPVDDAIVNDWHSMSRIVTGGNVRFDADRTPGGHADRFWAAALGLHAADGAGGEVGYVSAGRLRFARAGVF